MEDVGGIRLPPDDADWTKNNPRCWPRLVYEDLVDYLIRKKAYDGKEMRAFRSLYGKNYVESEWLGDVYYCKTDDKHFFKATVSPSQPGVGRSDYQTWAALSDNSIGTGFCSCPAGSGRCCSHIAAVLYAVIMAWEYGIAGESCNDKLRLWGRGASKVLSSHDEFADIVAKDKSVDKVSKPQQLLDHKDLEEFVNRSLLKSVWECKNTLLNKVLSAPAMTVKETTTLTHESHIVCSDNIEMPSCGACKTFFDQYVHIGREKIISLEEATREQNSTLWMDSRKVRITASKVNSLPKTGRANPDKFVTAHIYNRFKGCIATRHGQKFEPVARTWFEETTGLKVQKSGIVVRSDQQYLAASPDGVIDSDTILEIKCPTKPLNDLVNSGKYDVILQDGEPVLNSKGKNGYYVQVQMAMYCTRTKLCKFVVWTASKQLVIDVSFNETFVENILPRIRSFYFEHLLVRLAEEHHYGRLVLSPTYKKLCSQ